MIRTEHTKWLLISQIVCFLCLVEHIDFIEKAGELLCGENGKMCCKL